MRIRFMLAALVLLPAVAQAGLYKCTKNGRSAYQDTPCAKDSTSKQLSADTGGLAGLKGFPWPALTYGMSVEDVKARVPGTEPGSMNVSGGDQILLSFKKLPLEGRDFEANFLFRQGRYDAVALVSVKNENLEDVLPTYSRIYAKLTAIYGTPTHDEFKDKIMIHNRVLTIWGLNTGIISLGISPAGPGLLRLSLAYNPKQK